MIQPGPDEVDPADSQDVHGRNRSPHDQGCPVQNAESTPLVDPFHLIQTSCFSVHARLHKTRAL